MAGDSSAPPNASLREAAEQAFAPGGPLALALPGFEARPGQLALAAAVAQVFEEGGALLAEAGTGTGKTLAYLVPAILSRQRVLISTGTKNLQEQIFFKDLPTLEQALGVPFTATCMKGRANYLCLQRLDALQQGTGLTHDVLLPVLREWAARTDTGDRAELEDLPEDLPLWNEVSATSETCLGTECPRYEECFVTRLRSRAAASDLVLVNPHLLCADASVRQSAYGEVIPSCAHAILDEAHQLEDVATQYFGFSVSTYRVEELARDVDRLAQARGNDTDRREMNKAIDRLRERGRGFFEHLTLTHRSPARGEERVRLTAHAAQDLREAAAYLTGALDNLEASLALIGPHTDADGNDGSGLSSPGDETQALARRTGQLRDELRFLLRAGDPSYVYFVEFRGKGTFLRASPIDVSAVLRESVFDRLRTSVLTSATLTVDDSFEYIRGRLGLAGAGEIKLASEFDYSRQAVLYLPKRMPDPRSTDFTLAAGREVIEILKRTRGRAFVLFTSYAQLRAVQALAEMALDYPMLVQGTAPRSQLLRQFRETAHAVLFATSSFWQGVDVVGEALSCVIVDKLPFASPGDPITAARIDAIRMGGGEPFDDYQVPLAILALQQGLGRLIRHRNDRGVLAILDPRLRTKGYGRRFVAALPPAPVVHDLAAIEGFFSIV